MPRLFRRKTLLGVAVTVMSLAIAGVAIAYWTGNGTGSAGGVVGTSGTITIGGTIGSGLTPGNSVPVTFTVSNSGSSAIQVGTIHLVSVAVDASHSACVIADFTMVDVVENDLVPAHATSDQLAHPGSLALANTAVNQDACKNAVVTLTVTST